MFEEITKQMIDYYSQHRVVDIDFPDYPGYPTVYAIRLPNGAYYKQRWIDVGDRVAKHYKTFKTKRHAELILRSLLIREGKGATFDQDAGLGFLEKFNE